MLSEFSNLFSEHTFQTLNLMEIHKILLRFLKLLPLNKKINCEKAIFLYINKCVET